MWIGASVEETLRLLIDGVNGPCVGRLFELSNSDKSLAVIVEEANGAEAQDLDDPEGVLVALRVHLSV
jgi:hypothetical protein